MHDVRREKIHKNIRTCLKIAPLFEQLNVSVYKTNRKCIVLMLDIHHYLCIF